MLFTRIHKLLVPRRRSLLAMPAVHLGRHRTMDAAFTFRMGAGFAGDVNRRHPCTIEACLIDPTNPPLGYGLAVIVNTAANSVRSVLAGDQAAGVDIYGVTVRPFPIQDPGAAGAFGAKAIGAATPPATGIIDVLRSGYIMVPEVGQPTKGGAVNVWAAAPAGAHLLGGFEAAATGGSTFPITGNNKTQFNGPPDSAGIGELMFNV